MQSKLDQLNMFGKSKSGLILYGIFLLVTLVTLSIVGYPILFLGCIAVATFHGFAKIRNTSDDTARAPFIGRKESAVIAITIFVYAIFVVCLVLMPELSEMMLSPVWAAREHLMSIAFKERSFLIITFSPLSAASSQSVIDHFPLFSGTLALPVSLALFFAFERSLIAINADRVLRPYIFSNVLSSKNWLITEPIYLLFAIIATFATFLFWFWLTFTGAMHFEAVIYHAAMLLATVVATAITLLAASLWGRVIAYIVVFLTVQSSKRNDRISNSLTSHTNSRMERFPFAVIVTFTMVFAFPLGWVMTFLMDTLCDKLPPTFPLNWTEEKALVYCSIVGWATSGVGIFFFPLLSLLIMKRVVWRSMLSRSRDIGFEFNSALEAWASFVNNKSGCSLNDLYWKRGTNS